MKNSKFITNFNFKNKKVLILGGSGLIGKDIVKNYLALGAKVRVIDINNKVIKNLKVGKKSNLSYNFLDLSNNLSKEIIINSLKGFGCPNIFINCSYPKTQDWEKNNFSQIKLKSLNQNLNFHLGSYTYFAIVVAELMKNKKIKGNIIQFSSIYGIVGQDLDLYKGTKMRENISYSVIKGGILSLTRSMASYYGHYGIRVNTICPGGIYDKQDKKFVKNYSKKTPLGRMASKSEVTKPVIFLSSEGSSYITGTTLIVDGGITIK